LIELRQNIVWTGFFETHCQVTNVAMETTQLVLIQLKTF